jgi:hypothetical protein
MIGENVNLSRGNSDDFSDCGINRLDHNILGVLIENKADNTDLWSW